MTILLNIRHIVLLKFNSAGTPTVISEITAAFAKLRDSIEGVIAFESGENNSSEGLHRGYTHAFVLTYVDAESRDRYLPHPHHQAFVALLKPFLDDVLVIDYALLNHN